MRLLCALTTVCCSYLDSFCSHDMIISRQEYLRKINSEYKTEHLINSRVLFLSTAITTLKRPIHIKVGDTYRETDSVQQATESDWLTSACDFRCAEQSKTRLPSHVSVTITHAKLHPNVKAYDDVRKQMLQV